MTGQGFVADAGPAEVVIYFDTTRYAAYKLADLGANADDVLRANGWHKVGPWFRDDDMPPDHRVCIVEPVEVARLARDQEVGQERRQANAD